MEDFEDNDFIASEHDMLINAVSKLDKTQHVIAPTRSEPTNINSEFNLVKTHKKLNINKAVKVLEDTAHHTEISKRLKRSADKSRVLPKPLEKPQVERIKRSTGYEATKVKVGRWDPVVARSRTVDFVSFPLKRAVNKLESTGEFLTKFTLKSPLEKELEEVDPPPLQEAEDEEDKVYPMTYQEMVEQRQHLAKFRAQQSYKAAKSKRQGKIKSKKYHRILKKEKLKLQLKEFEELQRTNPEEALKKLEALEKARALERHTLRHKNTGKWAKSKLVRAKYDKEVRQQLAEQLSVSKGLTEKIQNDDSSNEEEEEDSNENEVIPDVKVDPMNPWILKKSDKSNIDAEFDFGYKKYLKDKMYKRKDDSDSDEEEDSINISANIPKLRESINNMMDQHQQEDLKINLIEVEENYLKNTKRYTNKNKSELIPSKQRIPKLKQNLIATSDWIVEDVNSKGKQEKSNSAPNITKAFETLENKVSNKVEQKLKKIRRALKLLEKSSNNCNTNKETKKEIDNLEYLKLKNQRMKPIIDEALIETKSRHASDEKNEETVISKTKNTQLVPDVENIDTNIQLPKFTENNPKYLNTALSNGGSGFDGLDDDDDDDEQVVPKLEMGEAFEDDDIVASFRKEKEDEMNKDQPTEIDNSMPGWGTWGGKGIKAPKRKKNRFILKAPPKMPRRDENKGDIIIKEYKDPKLSLHKVKDVPFPFTSVKDYEASIRAPIGNTFIPEKAYKKLIRPSVITKAGTIIEAMDEDELLVARNRNFRNEAVLKLLGQK